GQHECPPAETPQLLPFNELAAVCPRRRAAEYQQLSDGGRKDVAAAGAMLRGATRGAGAGGMNTTKALIGGCQKITGEDTKSSPVISKGCFVLGASVSGLLNQLGDFRRFGNVDGVAARHFRHLRFRASGHRPLSGRRNHL